MLLQELKDRRASMRGDATKVVEYNILALVIGELETATLGKEHKVEITEDQVFAVIRKLIKSNNETLKIVANEKLVKETPTSKLSYLRWLVKNKFVIIWNSLISLILSLISRPRLII